MVLVGVALLIVIVWGVDKHARKLSKFAHYREVAKIMKAHDHKARHTIKHAMPE